MGELPPPQGQRDKGGGGITSRSILEPEAGATEEMQLLQRHFLRQRDRYPVFSFPPALPVPSRASHWPSSEGSLGNTAFGAQHPQEQSRERKGQDVASGSTQQMTVLTLAYKNQILATLNNLLNRLLRSRPSFKQKPKSAELCPICLQEEKKGTVFGNWFAAYEASPCLQNMLQELLAWADGGLGIRLNFSTYHLCEQGHIY